MQFTSLLSQAGLSPLATQGEVEITHLCSDSRTAGPGSCFVAVRGTTCDGHSFLPQVVQAGVSAIICEDPSKLSAEARRVIPHAVVENTQAALGCLAQAFYGWPGRELTKVAITGTNGKSTVAHLIWGILKRGGHQAGLFGTISYHTGVRDIPASMTTPDAIDLAKMMREMVDNGATHLVMETSSHALHQHRTAGLNFQHAVFTNLSGDHLDYHGTMDEYLAAKCRLFESLSPDATALLNADDSHSERIAGKTRAKVQYYGLMPLADLRGRIDAISSAGTEFTIITPQQTVAVNTPLIGRHNVFNCLAAAGVCQAIGMELPAVADCLGRIDSVPGRLQRVPANLGFEVFVDYAHTDDALRNVLSALRPITSNRIIVLFGCGGDRDVTKRPRMAKVAVDLADHVLVTSDNPRSESPQKIIDDIVVNMDNSGMAKTEILPDRREAIGRAIEIAQSGDVVLIAGKGHETYQTIQGQKSHFDDAEEAAAALARREG